MADWADGCCADVTGAAGKFRSIDVITGLGGDCKRLFDRSSISSSSGSVEASWLTSNLIARPLRRFLGNCGATGSLVGGVGNWSCGRFSVFGVVTAVKSSTLSSMALYSSLLSVSSFSMSICSSCCSCFRSPCVSKLPAAAKQIMDENLRMITCWSAPSVVPYWPSATVAVDELVGFDIVVVAVEFVPSVVCNAVAVVEVAIVDGAVIAGVDCEVVVVDAAKKAIAVV